jgi:asparagine synthase (glutamine-hydrolysing)
MCGICGVISPSVEPAPRSLLEKMARTMRHRGPDEEGYAQLDHAALGFQRLSIIDLSTGHQPMSNEDDSLWITFNGEIYNFHVLRRSLEATGRHHFKTRSDTEMILHLYEEHGEDCLRHLRGMFAFAIWDRRTQRLFAARDRFGKKPFFYFVTPAGALAYASELKALRQHPECPSKIDLRAIRLYLTLQYIPAPLTIYEGIFKLPAAHSLSWSAAEGVRTRRYWDLVYDPKDALPYPEAQRRIRERLSEAVRLRMISDVPLGAFLSGGIDSSIIVALMARESSRPIQTFSIGFEEQDYSELAYAREVAKLYRTDHHEFIVKPELIDVLPKLAWYYSEPFADSSALPSYYLARETRRYVTVALTGDGGDENFAGYLRYRAIWGMQYWNKLPLAVRRGLDALADRVPTGPSPIHWVNRIKRLIKIGTLPEMAQYLRTMEIFHVEEQDELWDPDVSAFLRRDGITSARIYTETLARSRPSELMDRLMYLDLNHYLPDCLMVKMDIASMANSLEARAPLLDHLLVEEVARWPSAWKYRPLNFSKRILKDTFARELPPAIRKRGKQGFGVPISHWFRGTLRAYLQDTVLSTRALSRGYFRPDALRRLLDEHQSGNRDRSYSLWALLMLELWHQQYVDKF